MTKQKKNLACCHLLGAIFWYFWVYFWWFSISWETQYFLMMFYAELHGIMMIDTKQRNYLRVFLVHFAVGSSNTRKACNIFILIFVHFFFLFLKKLNSSICLNLLSTLQWASYYMHIQLYCYTRWSFLFLCLKVTKIFIIGFI